jgi:8-oxo-dGTP pyrophosphatase MutT (NUDIX family)
MKQLLKSWEKFLTEEKQKKTAGLLPISPSGKLLVGMRGRNGSHPLTLAIMGGHIEGDESPEECAKREFKEETGYKMSFGPLIKLGSYVKKGIDFQTFVTKFKDEWEDFDPPEEYAEETEWIRWFKIDDLLKRDDLIESLSELLNDEKIQNFLEKFISS